MTPPLFDLTDHAPTDEKAKHAEHRSRPKSAKAAGLLLRHSSNARDAIAGLERGECRHYVSKAAWSTHHLLGALLELTGPAHLTLATWSIAEDAVVDLIDHRTAGRLTSMDALLDWRVKVRRPKVLQLARGALNTVKVADCHAKVFTLTDTANGFDVVVLGSANLTTNPRVEAGVVHADPAAAEFHRQWIADLIAGGQPFDDGTDLDAMLGADADDEAE